MARGQTNGSTNTDLDKYNCGCSREKPAPLPQGKVKETDFVGDMAEHDDALNDPRNLAGLNLSIAWHFGDAFFDAASAGEPQVNGIPLDEAAQVLINILHSLRNGCEIDPTIGYMQPLPKTPWSRRFLQSRNLPR